MKLIKLPNKPEWEALCQRPEIEKDALNEQVKSILKEVQLNKDEALFDFTKKFDGVELNSLKVSESEIKTSNSVVSDELKGAIVVAKKNIQKFHRLQITKADPIETMPGVKVWRKSVGIEKVGIYIPGGSAPLFSTILMLAIPAKLAYCKEIVLCTPPSKTGKIHPAILFTANLLGVSQIFKVGGAQAIAAMAFGTESVPKVYKIFGPGNQYVTKAKAMVQQFGVAIDMPAGPSEVLVIADASGNPDFIAADLLSQAEHGTDSQVVLLSDNEAIINQSIAAIKSQLEKLPRRDIAEAALKNSRFILLKDMEACVEFSNSYAPEHLIVASNQATIYANRIINAGSVFLGNYSCESAGDYASGTNHTLPTNGFAKSYSGVSVESFQKKITFQQLSKQGLQNIGPAIETMAEAEELMAHKNAVSIRLKEINNG